MKQIKILLFLTLSLVFSTNYAQENSKDVIDAEVMDLITALAKLTDMADSCGEHMNFYGKKALEGAVCKEFENGFYSQWPTREVLRQQVENYTYRLENGEIACDNCRVMLQRVEELRITITYYLDYMDFLKEF